MKNRKGDDWFPFWIDKWLWGSTRLELKPDERSVWVDLLALSKKDEGFIRASVGVPYLETQLCGLLVISPELFNRTLTECMKPDKEGNQKILKLEDGTYFIPSTEKYALSKRHKRRINKDVSSKEDTMSSKEDIDDVDADAKSRAEQSRKEKIRIKHAEFKPASEEQSKSFMLLKQCRLPEKFCQHSALLLPYNKIKEIITSRAFTQKVKNPGGYLRRALESEIKLIQEY